MSPSGIPLRLSGVLPCSTHDITAAREQVLPAARPYLKNLPVLADNGYGQSPGACRSIVTNSGSQGGPVAYVRTVFAVYEVACVTRPRLFLRCYEPRI